MGFETVLTSKKVSFKAMELISKKEREREKECLV
jgi:hypothetical protein